MRLLHAIILIALLSSGCNSARDSLPDDYGKRRGTGLNGLGVFSEMFRRNGSRVNSWKRLSPKVHKQDTLIWAPTDYGLPTTEQIEFFEDWLQGDYSRTLILINRDYNAAIGHWRTLLEAAKGQQAIEIRRRLALAEAEISQRHLQAAERKCDWYSVSSKGNAGWADDFEGEWSEWIAAKDSWVYAGMNISYSVLDDHEYDSYEIEHLLLENDRPVISRITSDRWYDDCQVFVVSNGSTLFNQPLVNHENRKLAANIVASCYNPDRVMVLEGPTGKIAVRGTDASAPMMLKAFTVWPINFLMIHATLLGIFFCISVFPIFGRPRELSTDSVSDFGKHIAAYGEMLQRINAATYVRERLRHYRETTHSGQG